MDRGGCLNTLAATKSRPIAQTYSKRSVFDTIPCIHSPGSSANSESGAMADIQRLRIFGLMMVRCSRNTWTGIRFSAMACLSHWVNFASSCVVLVCRMSGDYIHLMAVFSHARQDGSEGTFLSRLPPLTGSIPCAVRRSPGFMFLGEFWVLGVYKVQRHLSAKRRRCAAAVGPTSCGGHTGFSARRPMCSRTAASSIFSWSTRSVFGHVFCVFSHSTLSDLMESVVVVVFDSCAGFLDFSEFS